MQEEIKVIDAEKKIIEVTIPQKVQYSKCELLNLKQNLLNQIKRIEDLISKCP